MNQICFKFVTMSHPCQVTMRIAMTTKTVDAVELSLPAPLSPLFLAKTLRYFFYTSLHMSRRWSKDIIIYIYNKDSSDNSDNPVTKHLLDVTTLSHRHDVWEEQ